MLYFVLTVIMFSLFEVTSKNLGISPYALTAIRFFIGGLTIFPISLIQFRKSGKRAKVKDIIKIGMLGWVLMSSCILLQIALINTTVSLCVFIYSFNAIFGAFAGWIFLKQRPHKSIWITCVIALTGLLIMTEPFKSGINIYALAVLASSVLFSTFNTLMFKMGREYGNLISSSISFLSGSLSLGLILILKGENIIEGVSRSNILPLLFIGIVCSGIVYLMFYKTMEVTSVGLASTVFLIKPVIATLLAIIFLKEQLTKTFLAGSVLILLGVSIAVASKYTKKKDGGNVNESAGMH